MVVLNQNIMRRIPSILFVRGVGMNMTDRNIKHFGKRAWNVAKRRKSTNEANDKPVHELEDDDYVFDALFVGAVDSPNYQKPYLISEELSINGNTIRFQFDTGA